MTKIRVSVLCGNWYESWDNATSEESMINDVVKRGAHLRIGCEDLRHELTRIERDIPVRWEFVLIVADAPKKAMSSSRSTSMRLKKLTDRLL